MKVSEARRLGRERLQAKPTPQLDSDLLLGHVLGKRREDVVVDERLLSMEQMDAYESLLLRRAAGEPVAYLTGHKPWFGLDIRVTPAVLIPRPETETLAEEAIRVARAVDAETAVDVGTGSGAIAIALAESLPELRVIATDASAEALHVARLNATGHGVEERVEFRVGNLLDPVTEGDAPDLIVANLPYLPEDDRATVSEEVLMEPAGALFAGGDGLDCIRALLRQVAARERWCPLVLEMDPRQVEAIASWIHEILPGWKVTAVRDLAGRYRVVTLVRR